MAALAPGKTMLATALSSTLGCCEMALMKDELFTMMLMVVFAAVLVVTGQGFIDRRNRAEAAAFLNSLAVSQARASP
jgi:hypothetical protein